MVAKLKSLQREVNYSRIEGVGHNVWNNAYSEELYAWMISKTRKNNKQ
jgi:hypothetical protein